ncbi:MAG TPA: AI-2E family transporter [Gemmatimonadales bacterium]
MSAPASIPRRAPNLGPLLIAAGLLVLFWLVKDLALVAFIAILLAVYLGGLTDLICRVTRIPRAPALLLSLVLTLGALFGIAMLVLPAVFAQTSDLIAAVPHYLAALDRMAQHLAETSEVFSRTAIGSGQSGVATSLLDGVMDFVRRSFFIYAAGTGRVLIDGAAVLAMSLYLALGPSAYLEGLLHLVPPVHRSMARAMAADIGATLRAWVGAQLLAMVVLAIATGIGLLIFGVPYWMAFSLLAGIAVMVPFFGSLTSTLLPALLVLPDRGLLASLAVASVGVIVHIIEANVVHPIIMQHKVSLPPALTILAVLTMAALAGLLGMVVAVPLLATVIVVVRHVLIYQTYGERPHGASEHAVLRPSQGGFVLTP